MSSKNEIHKEYRPSASLILAGQQISNSNEKFDYNLLLIKRTEQTAYALNHCVFPGGVFDVDADESKEWLLYFEECGVTPAQLNLLYSHQTIGRPELMQGINFSRDISLRLTALRETFEEVGILLCRNSLRDLDCVQPAQVVLQPFEREQWQKRVHNDATQFLKLCRRLSVVPDLWALSEWSVWRTPASASSRKYDTVYYFAALESNQIDLLLEPNEVESAFWLSPTDCWRQTEAGNIWLPYILLYETARLMSMTQWKILLQFARHRSSQGSTLLQPIFYRTNDCLFGVLPGDELYLPEPHNCTESIILPDSIQQINALAKHYHRYMIYGFHRVDFACNVQPLNGHLPLPTCINKPLSKL